MRRRSFLQIAVGLIVCPQIDMLPIEGNTVLPKSELDAFIPDMWAKESCRILEENMVIGHIIHKDFQT